MIPYAASFGRVKICNTIAHYGVDGKKYMVVHGDLFDGITRLAPWISFLGDRAYDFVLTLNSRFNWVRHRLGFGYWSLIKFLKHKVKKAVDFMFKFEENVTNYARRKGYDGVICGHIHNAEIKMIDGIVYMNDGDWVESCTALVEHHDGRWEIITWQEIKNEGTKTSKENVRSYSNKR
jgi:UDP-2,3-diacylglucosamine pyrophosphatase LpxH